MTDIQFVSASTKYNFLFSICTIVRDMEEYKKMKESFENCGFTHECEYLVADNTNNNFFDAYTAIRLFLTQAQGKYIIAAHQDIRCIDNKEKLAAILEKLTITDDKWALCGNAGASGFHQKRMHLVNSGEKIAYSNLPAPVNSLDENFIIIKKDANLSVSRDLKGFHFYGTDLCIIADFLGYTSYVIPFMVNHLSKGNLQEMNEYTKEFTASYSQKIRNRYIETTCTRFYLAGGSFKSRLLNLWPFINMIKIWERLKQSVLTAKGKNNYKKKTEPV